MKFKLQVDSLLKALSDVQGIVERKSITPILSNVMISAKSNSLKLFTTDMNLYVTKEVVATTEEEGSTTVPVNQLFEAIRKLEAKQDVKFEQKDDHLTLECNGFKGKLPCLSPSEFPNPILEEFKSTLTIKAQELRFLINKTRAAISTDETRMYLNGIYLHQVTHDQGKKHTLRAVATDGHRLARADINLKEGTSFYQPGIIIPRKTVDELHKVIERVEDDTNVDIGVAPNLISIKLENTTIVSNVIEGEYPDYSKVIPLNCDNEIEVNTSKLSGAIDLISIFSEEKIKAVKFDIKNDTLIVKAAKSDGMSEGEQAITLTQKCKDDILLSFNSRYLIDILSLIESDEVLIKLTTANAPTLITSRKENGSIFVVMPMRL